ncbi:MAG: ABC transporter substrate-binding protein [Acetobacteraceae bacterium]|nr:ABC transporter substrate-binding protein [Acetobacteraceae bacterium]
MSLARRSFLLGALAAPALLRPALAADRVRVAVFNVSSALPFWVAQSRGLFAAQNIEAVPVPLQTAPLIVQSLVTGDCEVASNLVTLEGANINGRRPRTAVYFALNGQNATHRMEQFMVRAGSTAETLADLRGARILSAPGPANMAAARGALARVGLQEGRDYTLTELPMDLHVGALAAGAFDAAFTLEPVASIAARQGAARLLEAGVIATYILGRRDAEAYAAGAAASAAFLDGKPDIARRFAAAWRAAIALIRADDGVRPLLTQHMNTPADIAPTVPLPSFNMVADMTPQQISDFQAFVDFAVQQRVVASPIQVLSFLRAL